MLSMLLFSVLAAQDAEWPQYNGPGGDRAASSAVEPAGLREVWRTETHLGFSSFTVAEGRAYTLIADADGAERCAAYDLDTGDELWISEPLAKVSYDGGGGAGAADNQGGDGPRSTPSFAGGRVYVFASNLALHALDAETGQKVWTQDLLSRYGGRNIRWQNATSPLVEGDRVLVAGGGPGESFLAFDCASGELEWKTGDELMTHATPVAATILDRRQVIFYMQSGLVALDPADGAELWRAEYPYRTSSAASPVVSGDLVYVSAGYGVGAGLFRIVAGEEGLAAELVWQKRNKLINHWSTPVCVDGHLYGMFSFKEYGSGPLACVRLSDGEELWSVEGFGPGNVVAAGDTLVALSDAGEVVLVSASPEGYAERAREDVLGGKCWSSPAVAAGQVYVRSTTEGVRLELGAAE